MFVYKVTNKENGMIYIGLTTRSVHKRWLQHQSCARQNINYPLYNAINHYGVDAFLVETIYEGKAIDDIKSAEIRFIKDFDSYIRNGRGYNLTYGGEDCTNMPQEARKRAAIALTGQKRTDEQKKAISVARVGKGLLNDSARKHPKEKIFMVLNLLQDGFKQQEVANITGLTQPYISRIKAKKRGHSILGA
jgi:group I intron endonuclease